MSLRRKHVCSKTGNKRSQPDNLEFFGLELDEIATHHKPSNVQGLKVPHFVLGRP